MRLLPLTGYKQRVRSLIWGACGIAAVIVILIVASLMLRDRADTLHHGQTEAYTLATVLADHADRVVENADLVISQAAGIAALAPHSAAPDWSMWEKLRELRDRSPYVSGIWIADAADNSILTSYIFPAPHLNASGRDYVRFIKENPDRLSITHVAQSLFAHMPQIKITRRLGRWDEPYRGFVTVDISQEQFKMLYSRLSVRPSTVLWLLDPAGRPLYREPMTSPDQFKIGDWSPTEIEGGRSEGIFTAVSPVSGKATLYVFRRSARHGLVSLVTVPLDVVLAPWWTRVWVYIALAAATLTGIGVLGAAGVGWFTRQQARSEELERRVHERTAALQEALKQKDVLVAELNHRVKNTLATIQSIARQTLRGSRDLQAFGQSFDERLRALSSTYALLTEADWTAASLADLLKAELSPYLHEEGCRVRFDGPPIQLPAALALSIGLVVHELTTNAAKYGALSTSSGHVDVRWTVTGQAGDPLLHMIWAESGGPPVSQPSRVGFGTRLMKTSFERVGGSVRFEYPEAGLQCFIEVPLIDMV